jgi:hypothetical protein
MKILKAIGLLAIWIALVSDVSAQGTITALCPSHVNDPSPDPDEITVTVTDVPAGEACPESPKACSNQVCKKITITMPPNTNNCKIRQVLLEPQQLVPGSLPARYCSMRVCNAWACCKDDPWAIADHLGNTHWPSEDLCAPESKLIQAKPKATHGNPCDFMYCCKCLVENNIAPFGPIGHPNSLNIIMCFDESCRDNTAPPGGPVTFKLTIRKECGHPDTGVINGEPYDCCREFPYEKCVVYFSL